MKKSSCGAFICFYEQFAPNKIDRTDICPKTTRHTRQTTNLFPNLYQSAASAGPSGSSSSRSRVVGPPARDCVRSLFPRARASGSFRFLPSPFPSQLSIPQRDKCEGCGNMSSPTGTNAFTRGEARKETDPSPLLRLNSARCASR